MRFSVLDGWRGVCAVLVALYHFGMLGHFFYWPLIRHSWLCVDFFFVLSGFVIAHSYGSRITSIQGLQLFVWRRIGRIYPLHIAMLLPYLVLESAKLVISARNALPVQPQPFVGANSVWSLASSVLMLQSMGLHDNLSWNIVSWSISVEFWTYIVFGLLTLFAHRTMLLIAFLIVGVAAAALTHLAGTADTTYDFGFVRCLYGFFTGYLLCRLYQHPVVSGYVPAKITTAWELFAVFTAGIYVVYLGEGSSTLAAPLVFGLVLFVFGFESGGVSRVLKSRPFESLGIWSYSIYMVHPILAYASSAIVKGIGASTHRKMFVNFEEGGKLIPAVDFGNLWFGDLAAVAYLLTVVGCATCTYRWIETPARDWFNVWARGKIRFGSRPVPQSA